MDSSWNVVIQKDSRFGWADIPRLNCYSNPIFRKTDFHALESQTTWCFCKPSQGNFDCRSSRTGVSCRASLWSLNLWGHCFSRPIRLPMPSLILSSRYTTDSQILREAARQRGWETLRLDGRQLPEWFDPPDDQIAMFYTAPHAFEIASQLDRALVGCPSDWTISLPQELISREIRQTTLAEALTISTPQFVKHSLSKAFPAAVYSAESLAEATHKIQPTSLVHVGEPVTFDVEYRCFVYDRSVATISPYRRFGNVLADHTDTLGHTAGERDSAMEFAESVLGCDEVSCPPALVLDVGLIAGRGWAVVEFNECWASGIYTCDPGCVLDTLVHACVPLPQLKPEWDFRAHYFNACP